MGAKLALTTVLFLQSANAACKAMYSDVSAIYSSDGGSLWRPSPVTALDVCLSAVSTEDILSFEYSCDSDSAVAEVYDSEDCSGDATNIDMSDFDPRCELSAKTVGPFADEPIKLRVRHWTATTHSTINLLLTCL